VKRTCIWITLSVLAAWTTAVVHATTAWDGSAGSWNSPGNWSNGVPGAGDNDARINAGGTVTVQPGTVVDAAGNVNIRMNWGNFPNPTVLNWNPGAGDQFVERITMGNHQNSGGSTFNHLSGTIRLDNDWFHVGRRGDATYISSGTAKIVADDRISLSEAANNHATTAYVEMFDNAEMRTRRGATSLDPADAQGNSGNESFIGLRSPGQATLIMHGNTIVESQAWRIGNDSGSSGTVVLNDSAQFRNRNNNQISLGRSGTGTMVANNDSQIMLLGSGGGSLRVGDNNNGVGNLTLNQNAKVIGVNGPNHHVVVGDDGTSKGTVTMNHNAGFSRVRNVWIGNTGSSEGTVVMRDNSYIDNTSGANNGDAIRIAQGGTASGTLLMFDQASIVTRNFGIDQASNGGAQATVVQNQNSTVKVTGGWMEIGGGNLDTSTYTMNNDSRLDAQGWLVVGQRANGRGEMYINDNASIESNAIGGHLLLGNVAGADGYLEISDSGSILARNALLLSNNNNTKGELQQNPGTTVQVNNFLRVGNNGRTGNAGTYNLDGGILRVNDIRLEDGGNFNWGDGRLTMREINANNSITVAGDLTTGTTGNPNAASTLDLGDLYKANGVKYDIMNVSGTLDLASNADILDFWTDIQHLRPGGGSGVEITGEIRLVGAGILNGVFENIIGPGEDATFFRTWTPAEVGLLGINGAGDLTRNRGAIVYRTDGVYFAYNISGQIPEPSTGIFFMLGIALLRGVFVLRRSQELRSRSGKID
jgi:hypothetical protein